MNAQLQLVLLATITRRLIGSLVLIWLVLSLTFLLVRLAPGDPGTLLISPTASAADAARLRADLGLDQPIAVQYARWSRSVLRGDLGESFTQRRPVTAILADALPISAFLGMTSLALTFLIC